MLMIDQVLTPADLARVNADLDGLDFEDGKRTAGPAARPVKANEQARKADPIAQALAQFIAEALQRNPLFAAYARPQRLSPILLNQYRPGMAYGRHVDDAIMGASSARMRSDLSFTLFLSAPESYDGGALRIEGLDGDRRVKLAAGQALVYPASSIHEVEPVTRGLRRAAVGWVQSLVRDARCREILFDLWDLRARLAEAGIARDDLLVIDKTQSNLLRLWAEL